MIIWPVFFRYYLSEELYDKHIGGQEWTFVWCGAIITVQSLVWLSTNWNVNLKSLFTSTSAKTVKEAQLIKVLPVANAGTSEICKIVRDNVSIPIRIIAMTLTVLGRRQTQHLFPLPKASVPL
jgi:cation-transporting ATPase 13A1